MSKNSGLFVDADCGEPLVPPKKIVDGELDITPMIDVTFLLLIFFMVSSTMKKEADVDVPIAKYGVGVETERATPVVIQMEEGAAGSTPVIKMDVGRGGEERIDAEAVRRRVAELMRSNKRQFLIKAERHVPHGTVQEVARAIMENEGAKFYIGVHEK